MKISSFLNGSVRNFLVVFSQNRGSVGRRLRGDGSDDGAPRMRDRRVKVSWVVSELSDVAASGFLRLECSDFWAEKQGTANDQF